MLDVCVRCASSCNSDVETLRTYKIVIHGFKYLPLLSRQPLKLVKKIAILSLIIIISCPTNNLSLP